MRILRCAAILLLVLGCVHAQPGRSGQEKGNGNGNGNGNDGTGPGQPGRGAGERTVPAAATKTDLPGPGSDQFSEKLKLVEDELIIQFKPGASEQAQGKALARGRAKTKRVLKGKGGRGDLALVKVTDEKGEKVKGRSALKAAARSMREDEDVEFVEPNFIYNRSQVTNDPQISQLWGMLGSGGGANAAGAWTKGYTSCDDVVVGIIDTGIDMSHPDLKDMLWTNPGETPPEGADPAEWEGVDNDGNGWTDDINGFDFYWYDNTVFDDDYDNDDSHGTHVAGTVGATGNNAIGVSGVCQRGLKIIPAKFMSAYGGYTFDAVYALDWLLDLKERYNINLVATSNSWGGGGYSQCLYEAIQRHNDAGILFVAAAGNDGIYLDFVPDWGYPATYDLPNVISVGSITSSGGVSGFSNIGASTVDVFAPGSSIRSTWPVPYGSYATISGTSMATPMVTGAIALYSSWHKKLRGTWPLAAQIKAAVLDTGVPLSTYTTRSVSGKRLNINNLMNTLTGSFTPLPKASPGTLRRMYAKVLLAPLPYRPLYIWSDELGRPSWFYALAAIQVFDAGTNAMLRPSTYLSAGEWTLQPDIDWYTDPWSLFPSTVPTYPGQNMTLSDSPDWLPTAAVVSEWFTLDGVAPPADFNGTRCSFRLTGVYHPNYVWDKADARNVVSVTFSPM